MRKACQILLAVLLVLFMPAMRADSADSVRIVSECIDNSAAGSCIIRVYAHGGSGIMGFRLHFSYPADKLRVIAARKGSVTEKGTMTDNIGLNEGEFDLLWNNTEEVSAEGVLAVISAELLKAGEPFTIDVGFGQEDTFNEKWEDVVFDCEPVFTADIAEEGRYEPAGEGAADTALIIESAMKDAPRRELSDSEKQAVLERVNSAVGSEHFADFGELSREYGRLLLDKLPEEAEKLPTDMSAAQIIADVLAQRGETEVSSDNADAVTERFVAEGLDEDYGEYIDTDDIVRAYNDMLGETAAESESDKLSEHSSADNLPYVAAVVCILTAAAGSGILLYCVRRRNNAQK
ncbi:MAG: hypothetical protein Q4A05_11100 [Ruminococcus sp.]|nr:hypothetical protein [Ruminococcus sp.]